MRHAFLVFQTGIYFNPNIPIPKGFGNYFENPFLLRFMTIYNYTIITQSVYFSVGLLFFLSLRNLLK
jgi:hypothetical protein